MTRTELDAILTDLEGEQPHPCGPDLPGRSSVMVTLADSLRRVAGRLAAIAEDDPIRVVFHAPDGGLAEAEALLRLAGLDPAGVTRLRSGTPAYNAGLLFGSGVRAGLVETPAAGSRVIIGVEHLTGGERERLVKHIHAWCRTGASQTPIVLVATGTGTCPEFDGRTFMSVRLPPLAERPSDLPYVLQAAARRRGAELAAGIRPNALQLLLSEPWPGGLAEIEGVFAQMFRQDLGGLSVVDSAKVHLGRLAARVTAHPVADQVWSEVDRLCAQCDELCHRLIGVPFFRPPAVPSRPMADAHPPFRFFRLVAWGYCKLKEEGWPNLRILRALPPETDTLKAVEQDFDCLRTLHQHWLDPGKGETTGLVERGREWFRQACCREQPDDGDLELCLGHLLDALRVGLVGLRDRLVQIEADSAREMLTAQWKDRREIEWPEHRMKAFLQQVLLDLNRQDNLNALFNRIREEMRKELVRHLGAPERREAAVRAWLEGQLTTTIRPPFPVTSRELIPRGVPRERMEECIRHLKAAYQRDPRLTSEGLIRLAVERYGAGI